MTFKDLSQFQKTVDHLERLDMDLQELEARATDISPHLFAGSGGRRSDKTALAVSIADKKNRIKTLQAAAREKLQQTQAFVDTIQDDYIKDIFRYRFECLWTWQKIAVRLNSTEAAVRMTAARYLKQLDRRTA